MNVASITESAINHGLTFGIHWADESAPAVGVAINQRWTELFGHWSTEPPADDENNADSKNHRRNDQVHQRISRFAYFNGRDYGFTRAQRQTTIVIQWFIENNFHRNALNHFDVVPSC